MGDEVPTGVRDALGVLRRWEDSGGTWRVVLRTPTRVELELLTCDAGEAMQRLTAAPDPALVEHLAGRLRSDA